MQSIIDRYTHLPGNAKLVFDRLCALLSENVEGMDWSDFGQDEWGLLAKMAVEQGVAAMAYYMLRTQPEATRLASFDVATYQMFAEREAVTAIRNAMLFKQLRRLLIRLSENHVPVVLLKGADLARSLYPQPGLREMGDLDLWVAEAHFTQGLELVKSLGYQEDIPEASPGFNRLLSHHVHLRNNSPTATQIELHWTLIAPPAYRHAVATDWFWQNLEPARDWNEKGHLDRQAGVFALNPTANLLYLSAHQLLQHGKAELSLRWLLDLQRLVELRAEEIDWQMLTVQARQFGWCGPLGLALEAVETCFGTRLPEELLASLQAQAGSHDARLTMISAVSPTRTLGAWRELSSLDWSGRLRLLRTRLFPALAYVRWRYPPRAGWCWRLSYLHLWLDIARDGWQTLRYLFRSPSRRG